MMNIVQDHHTKQYGGLNSLNVTEIMENNNGETEAERREVLVDWINNILPNLNLTVKASNEELRACLIDGTVLCRILNRLRPCYPRLIPCWGGNSDHSSVSGPENVKRFLEAMDELGIPRFEISDLEKGSINTVMDCLLTLRAQSMPNIVARDDYDIASSITMSGSPYGNTFSGGSLSPLSREEGWKLVFESKFQSTLRGPAMSEQSTALMHHVGHKFHEVFQLKQVCYSDLPAAKLSEMMKSNSLDNAPTQSLLGVVNGILDESVERKNGEIPHRVACLLRKVVQEIERRISTQAEHLRTQNNLFKAREEKYLSRIRVLEALANGTSDETQTEKTKMEEKKKFEDEDADRLMKEKDQYNHEISTLKKELEIAKKAYELHNLQRETQAMTEKTGVEERVKELERHLVDSRNKVKELEAYSKTKYESWNKRDHIYRRFIDIKFGKLQEMRSCSESIKQEILETQKCYSEEFHRLGVKINALGDAAEKFHEVLAENRRLFNEVQDLKGNIRVFCRTRPFLPGQTGKQTSIEYIGENGELGFANPSKQGKDNNRLFRFNKVFGPAATQAEVYSDMKPFVRSVLDGYNVCIFAYGQTGSGKTYTMTGPNAASEEDRGVNYRALNDLFSISQNRRTSIKYEIAVQMIEIYNEQVRDLLSSDGSQKKLGILTTPQPNGIAVPDASMNPVTSTSDILELMDIGFKNRAVGATVMNERSSRSHSIVTIHVRGTDLKTGAALHGSLHLVDLAGSERVDRSEVTGDRLKEAQHINKSLSALGDVIFALSQKSPHVPYRNSKLTQVLQSSLGGQAKTLMFVQLNPDANSYAESLSTLKFAERVSGIELGAARSSKDGRDVGELMDQVASLKDTIAKKDEEIEQLQLLKDLKKVYPIVNGEKRGTSTLRYGSSSPSKTSVGVTPQQNPKRSSGKGFGLAEKENSDHDRGSEHSSKHFESGSQQSTDDFKHQNEISDGALSVGTETDGSAEHKTFPDGTKLSNKLEKSKLPSKISRPVYKPGKTSSNSALAKEPMRVSTGMKRSATTSTLLKASRRWA